MKLCDHPDFDQVIIKAAEHFEERGLRPSIIEKDYYVTEALRRIAASFGGRVMFKGGTSLSKGWNLVQRFSEDVDLFLDPEMYDPPLGKKAIDRELKKLRDSVSEHSALTFVSDESQTVGGFGRADRFIYKQRFGTVGEIANRVLVESGTASGREPTEVVQISSYLSQFLLNTANSLDAEDELPFSFKLLHYRRTFVEKLFAIHGKVELQKREGRPIGSYARRYYDLNMLSGLDAVIEMLQSDEYDSIKEDYDRISRKFFYRSYYFPAQMSFLHSDAIFPTRNLRKQLGKDYETQCRLLCFGDFPTWEQVLGRFEEMRNLL